MHRTLGTHRASRTHWPKRVARSRRHYRVVAAPPRDWSSRCRSDHDLPCCIGHARKPWWPYHVLYPQSRRKWHQWHREQQRRCSPPLGRQVMMRWRRTAMIVSILYWSTMPQNALKLRQPSGGVSASPLSAARAHGKLALLISSTTTRPAKRLVVPRQQNPGCGCSALLIPKLPCGLPRGARCTAIPGVG